MAGEDLPNLGIPGPRLYQNRGDKREMLNKVGSLSRDDAAQAEIDAGTR